MSKLERILRELREEVERLEGQAPLGAGAVDPSRLSDEDLARVEILLVRLLPDQGEAPGLSHYPGADDERRGWACGCVVCESPKGTRPPELDGSDLRELSGLLERARVEAA